MFKYLPIHNVMPKFMLAQLGLGALQSQHISLPGILTNSSNVLKTKVYSLMEQE